MSVNQIPPLSHNSRVFSAIGRSAVRHASADAMFRQEVAEASAGKAAREHEPAAAKDPGSGAASDDVVTKDERRFFEGLFPNAAEEVRSYTIYKRNGVSSQAAVGSLLDRRG